jgi:hypothetical protein
LKLHFFHHLLLYCDISSEIIQNVAYDNYVDCQHANYIFSQNFISLFWGLFNDETHLRVRSVHMWNSVTYFDERVVITLSLLTTELTINLCQFYN